MSIVIRHGRRALIPAMILAAALIAPAGLAHAAEPAQPAEPGSARGPWITETDNPICKVSDMMKRAGKLLDSLETGEPTQEEQKNILAELDVLIKMAEKSSQQQQQQQQQQQNPGEASQQQQQKNPGSSGKATGASPAPDETDITRTVTQQLGESAPDLRELWGKLPEAQRDDFMQLLSEPLPLEYKLLIILYSKALSEER